MPPYLLLSLLIGAVYGTIFHLWRGKNLRDLAIFGVSGAIAFVIGQLIGTFDGLNLLLIGQVDVLVASVISISVLLLVNWLKL